MVIILADELSQEFETVKTASHMMKLDTETSLEVLDTLINNMALQTNLTTKMIHSKRKNSADIITEKVVVGGQKTRISIHVKKIKNTKDTFQITYDIDLPMRPIFGLCFLLTLIVGVIFTGWIGLAIAIGFYMLFSTSDQKKIQRIFPIKSILHDAILELKRDGNTKS